MHVRYNPKAVDEHFRRISKQLSEQHSGIEHSDAINQAWGKGTSWQDIHSPAAWHGVKAVEQQWLLNHKRSLTPPSDTIRQSLSQVPDLGSVGGPNPPWLDSVSQVAQAAGKFLRQINEMIEQVANVMSPALTGIARISEELARPVQGLHQMIRNIPSLQNFDRFWDQIQPVMHEFVILLKDAEEGRAALEASEFGFADHFWNMFYLRGFAHLHPQTRDANITRQLVAYTTSDAFVEQLGTTIGESNLMQKRWRIVEAACEAHAARNYDLAVPAILAQVEGALVDLMFLKELVKKENGQFYLADENGNFRLNSKGKRLGPVTLGNAIRNAKLNEHENLGAASEFIANTLVKRRNSVLHGHDLTYGKAKFSVQAVLMFRVLARAVSELESGEFS